MKNPRHPSGSEARVFPRKKRRFPNAILQSKMNGGSMKFEEELCEFILFLLSLEVAIKMTECRIVLSWKRKEGIWYTLDQSIKPHGFKRAFLKIKKEALKQLKPEIAARAKALRNKPT